jgi:hypothetical protein
MLQAIMDPIADHEAGRDGRRARFETRCFAALLTMRPRGVYLGGLN